MIQNFVSKLSEQEKKILYIAAAFVLIAVFDRLFLGPVMSRLHSLDEEIKKEQNDIRSDLRIISYKDRIMQENDAMASYYTADIKTEEEIIADFLKRIEVLSTDAKVNLIKVSPSEVRQKKGYIEYYANLEAEGKLSDIVSFMHSIDVSGDLLKIVNLNVTPKRASAEEVKVDIVAVKVLIDLDSIEQAKREMEAAAMGLSDSLDGKKTKSGVAGLEGEQSADGDSEGVAKTKSKVSERFQMKTVKSKKAKKKEEEEENVIQESIFEKIIQKQKAEQ